MFRRILLDDSIIFYTFIAFAVSASIFVAFLWRAFRMKKEQVKHYENLPFEPETSSARHDS